jgi:chromosome segregation ATPase
MELQFEVDDLASQVEGWRESLEGLTSEADGWKVVLQELKHDIKSDEAPIDGMLNSSMSSDRHEELSNEIAMLEEKMLAMDKEHQQQSSMHKSIVDGLEARCEMLSEEHTEALGYISSLEDSKVRLQNKIDQLKKECDVHRRRLSELESVLSIMKQQKSISETLCDEILTGLRKLTGVAIMYSSRLEGFSDETSSPSSWSVNIEYISRFIECALKLNQKYLLDIQKLEASIESMPNNSGVQVIAEAITPKAKGSGVRSVMPDHLDMINDIKNMKDVIKTVMASPKLTPMKAKHRGCTDDDDVADGDLYSDLLMAYDQLESLSKKIESYQEEQVQWKDRESTLQARIEELEGEKQQLESSSKSLVEDMSKVMESDHERISSKHLSLSLVKGMARELNMTREKVRMLKSNVGMDGNTRL